MNESTTITTATAAPEAAPVATPVATPVAAPVEAPKLPHVVLQEPIVRGATKIETLTLRKPKAGSLRGINLSEILTLRADSVIVLLPRITEPPLVKHEVESMDPVDLIACAGVIVNFFVPQNQITAAEQKAKEYEYLQE